jgi:hypothetical protein
MGVAMVEALVMTAVAPGQVCGEKRKKQPRVIVVPGSALSGDWSE